MMKILVIGSKGQLGRCLELQLPIFFEKTIFISKDELDISNFRDTSKLIRNLKPNIVINAAAYTNVDLAEKEYDHANTINHLAVKNIAESCKKINALLIHFSTDYIFEGVNNLPLIEESKPSPINAYGVSKLSGEKAIQVINCKYLIIRTSWVYSEYEKNFLRTIMDKGIHKSELKIVSDQYGCPTYAMHIAENVAKIILKINTNNFVSGVYHYCGNQILSWYEFAVKIFDEAKSLNIKIPKIVPIKTSDYSSLASRPYYSVLDTKKIKNDFQCMPSNTDLGISSSLKEILRNG